MTMEDCNKCHDQLPYCEECDGDEDTGENRHCSDPSGSTATCVLEAKDGRVWKTIDKQIVPLEHLKSTLEWLEIFGNRQFSRHAKRRVRRIK